MPVPIIGGHKALSPENAALVVVGNPTNDLMATYKTILTPDKYLTVDIFDDKTLTRATVGNLVVQNVTNVT